MAFVLNLPPDRNRLFPSLIIPPPSRARGLGDLLSPSFSLLVYPGLNPQPPSPPRPLPRPGLPLFSRFFPSQPTSPHRTNPRLGAFRRPARAAAERRQQQPRQAAGSQSGRRGVREGETPTDRAAALACCSLLLLIGAPHSQPGAPAAATYGRTASPPTRSIVSGGIWTAFEWRRGGVRAGGLNAGSSSWPPPPWCRFISKPGWTLRAIDPSAHPDPASTRTPTRTVPTTLKP